MLWHSYLFAVNWHRTYTKAPKHQQGKTTRQSMCLSVRPCFTCQYHTKRLNAGSRKQRCTIARGLWFSSKRSQWNSDGITPMRAPNGKNVVFRPVENFLIQTMFRRKFMSIRHDRPQRWRCAGGGGGTCCRLQWWSFHFIYCTWNRRMKTLQNKKYTDRRFISSCRAG